MFLLLLLELVIALQYIALHLESTFIFLNYKNLPCLVQL